MISAPNPLRQLSGNKFSFIILIFLLGGVACSASKQSSYLQNEKKETTQNPDDIIPDKRKQEDEIKQKSHPEKPEIVNDFHVAVLLPFSLNKDILPSSREYVVLESVTDYYQGILLALDDLKKFGIVITLHVYDTQKDSIHTAALLKKPEMASMDLIIGPLDPPCFQMINTFSKSYSIPIVAPFSLVNSQTPANPLAFYCSPDLESYGLAAGSYMSEHRKNARFFYLSDGSSTDKAFKKGLNVWKDSMGLKITERKIVPEMDVMPLLSKNDSITNYILLPSDNEKMVNLALRSFKPAEEEEYRLKVIGLDTWMDFRDPEMDHWDKMQACIITAWSENSEDSSFQKFNNTFREKFQIPPGKYALKGYDQMMFFGEALLAFGKGFPAYTRDTEFMGVGMDFTWHFTGRVIQNRALRLLHYYDYRFVYKP